MIATDRGEPLTPKITSRLRLMVTLRRSYWVIIVLMFTIPILVLQFSRSPWPLLIPFLGLALVLGIVSITFGTRRCPECGEMMIGLGSHTFRDAYFSTMGPLRRDIFCRHCGLSVRSLGAGTICRSDTAITRAAARAYVLWTVVLFLPLSVLLGWGIFRGHTSTIALIGAFIVTAIIRFLYAWSGYRELPEPGADTAH